MRVRKTLLETNRPHDFGASAPRSGLDCVAKTTKDSHSPSPSGSDAAVGRWYQALCDLIDAALSSASALQSFDPVG